MKGNRLIQEVQFFDKYARWDEAKGRRETWEETVERVWGFFQANTPLDRLTEPMRDKLYNAFLNKQVLPAMRIVQMAGPALERCNVGAYNCCYSPIENFKDISDILYILMQGTGVGFSVERKYVEKLPQIRKLTRALPLTMTVPDTTEGWADSVHDCLWAASMGYRINFDYSQIRPKGTRLVTKGGVASGPAPLIELHEFIVAKFNERRQAGFLRPIDVYDIVCKVGAIVEVGGVRRAALMCLCDLDDVEMRDAKKGEFWHTHDWRARSNNSAVYTTRTVPEEFTSEFAALRENRTGERGIFNRAVAHREGEVMEYGTNPCGEIILRPRQFCNLSIAVVRPGDSTEDLNTKVRLAAVFGTLQATLTNFNYISGKYKENCEKDRLLGVDITGQLDHPTFSRMFIESSGPSGDIDADDQLFRDLRSVAQLTNFFYARDFRISSARAVTTVKPSGNSAQFLDCASGLHPRFSPYYIRRLRIGAGSPVAKVLEEIGIPGELGIGEETVKVFEFPVESPKGAVTRHESGAIKQLQYWLKAKMYYTDHNPSCTVYVKDDEWDHVEEWVRDHFEHINGISFLPYDGGVYKQAPYEEISKERYEELVAKVPENVDWPTLLRKYETTDTTTSARELACVGGVCEL